VKIYPIGIGANPEDSGSTGLLGVNPSLDLDEPALKAIAEVTGGQYFAPTTAKSCKRSKTPSTSSNPSPSNRPKPARHKPCISGPWRWRCG
jgi:Ca-activated chloride channel family protein